MNLKELRAERERIAKQMRDMHDSANKEERSFSADDNTKWAQLDARLEELDGQIRRSERLESLGTASPEELRAANRGNDRGNAADQGGEDERSAFGAYLREGMSGLNDEQRAIMAARRADMTRPELRAFAAGTGNVGGATVPQDFLNRLEIALRAYGGMMEAAEVMRTDTGATLPMPTFNYTNVVATIVGEGTGSSNDSSTPFGSANLGAFTYRSPLLPISYEFLQDSSFGEQYIIDALRDSLGRGINGHATTGTGTGQPRGIITDAVLGKAGTTGQTVTVLYDDLVDLQHSVNQAYRKVGRFMFADSTLKIVRKIKDSQGRPIFVPGYEVGTPGGAPDTLLGSKIVINDDMAAMAANAKSIVFGALEKYKLRIVRDVTVLRLTERYADQLQVAFLLFMRADGRLLDAGTNPVKYYQNSAT